ncbi:MAG: hypothetical protein RL117_1182 [Verrucomicrobiota bacterium]
MLWEAYQQTKIAGAERTADRAMSKADRYAADIAKVERQIERLTLACQALWELLRERTNLTENDMALKMLEIDGRDGKVDGKIATSQTSCSSCGRPSNSRRSSCVICGSEIPKQHRFEG